MAHFASLLAGMVIYGITVFKDNKFSDSTLVSEAEATVKKVAELIVLLLNFNQTAK